MPPVISLAVPMYNEAEGLDTFFERVGKVLRETGLDYEIVCVNDGSRDETLASLLRYRELDPRIIVVDLSRNFGKDIALTAAIDNAGGDVVIPMDADLQDPPEMIPQMIEKWKAGADMVVARRKSRKGDSPFKRISARMFYRIFNAVTTVRIPPDAGDFRLMNRKVVDAIHNLPEGNRFMKGLFAWVGFRTESVDYVRQPRARGKTKFSVGKLWNFAMNGIVSFSSFPLRVWSYIGALISFLSLAYAVYLVIRTLISGCEVPGYPSLMVAILFMGGVQLISLGVIGEYLDRIYYESKRRPLYLTRNIYR